MLTTDKQERKERPIFSGVLSYFPDAIAEVANVSYVGNQQHNPGEPLHWAREKSADHSDCVGRHLIDHGKRDNDGQRHTAKMVWRGLAMLQLEIEADKGYELTSDAYSRPESEPAPDAHCFVPCDQYTISIDLASKPDRTAVHIYHNEFAPHAPETLPETEALNAHLEAREAKHKPVRFSCPKQQRDANDIFHLGCRPAVADQIALGTSYGPFSKPYSKYVYIAGPMRGYEKFNFPAFDAARDRFLQNGWNVISPADIDRHDGIKEDEHKNGDASEFDQRVFVYRDFFALFFIAHTGNGAIAMLPGWEKSTGAVGEFFLARWLGLKVLDAETGKPLTVCFCGTLSDVIRTFLANQEQ